jgi:mRNA-degrading endonuclease RelE of RelBE toxin-antitoxin system
MKIDYTRQFLKDLEVLEPQVSLKIQQYIETLKVTDNISSARKMRKMVGYKNYYRLRF